MTQAGDDPANLARALVRRAGRATLATQAVDDGGPYASLVMMAVDYDASPILLLSTLAEHTRNLTVDARVSLLIDGTAGYAPPLTGPRVSLVGRAVPADAAHLRRRYLARYADAADYAGFQDFAFYRVAVERAHLVAGFGRIDWIGAADLLPPVDAAIWAGLEEGVVDHMNADHSEAVDLYATVLLGASGDGWRLVGCDPDGCDLQRNGEFLRLAFATAVEDATGVRQELVRLAQQAREQKVKQR